MSQFNTPPVRRAGGSVDVYTGLLFVALLILSFGVFTMATTNMEHSKANPNDSGGVLTIID